jgi:arginase family enzyme
MRERGYKAYTAFHAHRVGATQSIREALDYVTDGVDVIYVSIDIDVVNNAHAPATASSVFQGLSGDEYLDAIAELARVENLIGIDLCEVDPEVDGSWRTELLAASSLLSLLGPRIYRQEPAVPASELQTVFIV